MYLPFGRRASRPDLQISICDWVGGIIQSLCRCGIPRGDSIGFTGAYGAPGSAILDRPAVAATMGWGAIVDLAIEAGHAAAFAALAGPPPDTPIIMQQMDIKREV